jgi:hypothetical protein
MEANVKDGLYQVTTPYLCAGFIVSNGVVTHCAPILKPKLNYWVTIAKCISNCDKPFTNGNCNIKL